MRWKAFQASIQNYKDWFASSEQRLQQEQVQSDCILPGKIVNQPEKQEPCLPELEHHSHFNLTTSPIVSLQTSTFNHFTDSGLQNEAPFSTEQLTQDPVVLNLNNLPDGSYESQSNTCVSLWKRDTLNRFVQCSGGCRVQVFLRKKK
jgi:hypothetical protein